MRQWRLSEAECRLSSGDRTERITPKAATVLGLLVDRAGEVVTRDEILRKAWAGLNVTPDLVREYVFDLRAVLGCDAQNPSYIETVRGRGFRLLGGVSRLHAPEPGAEGAGKTARPMVAVLAPQVEGADDEPRGAAQAILEETIHQISRFEDVQVVGRTLSFGLGQASDVQAAAEALGAGYLLESSVSSWPGSGPRLHLRCVNTRSASVLWSETFDLAPTKDQQRPEDIASAAVNALVGWQGVVHRAEFAMAARRSDARLSAFDHFVRACDIDLVLDGPGVQRALHHLDQALERDPHYARCWLIKGIMLRWGYDLAPRTGAQMLLDADAAIDRAYVLDPGDATTLAMLSLRRARTGDLANAADLARQAERTCAMDADAWSAVATPLAVVCGDLAAADHALTRAFALNPTPPGLYRLVETRIAFLMGAFERAITASRIGTRHVSAIALAALSQASLGQRAEAAESWAAVRTQSPEFTVAGYAKTIPFAHPLAAERLTAARALLSDCADKVA